MQKFVEEKAAQAASARNSKFNPVRRTNLVYLTTDYNCYDEQNTALCRVLANKLIRERHAKPFDADWLVDCFRDELASIMSRYIPGGPASAHTFASKRLPYRLNNVWNKYKAMCNHNGGRTVSLEEPLNLEGHEKMSESGEVLNALAQLGEEYRRHAERRLLLERLAELVADMPEQLRQPCVLIMTGDSMTSAARKMGITHQTFSEVWLPKIKRYFLDGGLFDVGE